MSSFTGKSFKDYMASVKEKGQILDNSFGTDKKEIVNVKKTANDIIKEHLQSIHNNTLLSLIIIITVFIRIINIIEIIQII